jgi:S1-C subfamily serine protease
VLYPYPLPSVVGLTMDPMHRATVAEVAEDSPAATAGFQAGDELLSLSGQPLLSTADIQWVLHNASDADALPAAIRRADEEIVLRLPLDSGWRQRSDISWRATTWDLRRMGTGGLVLVDLTDEERRERKLPADGMALRVEHVGQYNEHAAAKNAGFEQDDVIVAAGGSRKRMSETNFLAMTLNEHQAGDRIPCTVLRGNRRLKLELPLQ